MLSPYGDRQRPAKPHGQVAHGAPLPQPEQQEQLPCPRCDSTNTKFCYYNYNFSQVRHLCKSCCRYWTRGGTLRHIPVGGGTHKNSRRYRVSAAAATSAAPALQQPLEDSVAVHALAPAAPEEPETASREASGIGGFGSKRTHFIISQLKM